MPGRGIERVAVLEQVAGVVPEMRLILRDGLGVSVGAIDLDTPRDLIVAGAVPGALAGRAKQVRGLRAHRVRRQGGQDHIGKAPLSDPVDRLLRARTRDPDRRMWLLKRLGPHVHVAELIVLTLPGEWAWLSPRFDDQLVRLAEPLTCIGWVDVVREEFVASPDHLTRHHPPAADDVEH